MKHSGDPILSLVLPTYNERDNIEVFIPHLAASFYDVPHEILVIDDNSPDGTGEAVRKLSTQFPQVKLFTRWKKEGIGAALRYGYDYARGDIIISSDTDCSFDGTDIRKLYDGIINGFDMVIGSRHSDQSIYEAPSWKIHAKYMASHWGNTLLRLMFGIPIHDFSVNCRAIRRETWQALATTEHSNFFLFEMILRAKACGARIGEVPITFKDRRFGISKINHVIEIPKAFYKMILFFLR